MHLFLLIILSTSYLSAFTVFTMSNDTNSTECGFSKYDSSQFLLVAGVRLSVGFLSSVCCLGVIFIILQYKKYMFSTQRLILYLSIAALTNSISLMLGRVNYYSSRPVIDPYCYFAGFLWLYTGWTELLSICCITFNLFSVMVMKNFRPWFEFVYVIVIFLSPLLWCWIPYVGLAFGTEGPWCGIRYTTEDCQVFNYGNIVRFFVKYIPTTILIGLFILPVNVGIAIKARNELRNWHGDSTPQTQQEIKMITSEVRPLLWYPVIYAILFIPVVLSTIYTAIKPFEPLMSLWLITALMIPFAGTTVAIVYALDSETLSRINVSHLLKRASSLFRKQPSDKHGAVSEYNFDQYSLYGDSIAGRNERPGCTSV